MSKNKVGRPRVWNDPKALQARIDEYFDGGHKWREIPAGEDIIKIPVITWAGLVLFCGFSDRHAFDEYAKYPEFSATIKRAKLRVMEFYEECVMYSKNPTAPIFLLKCMGYYDQAGKAETEQVEKASEEVVIFKANGLELKVG